MTYPLDVPTRPCSRPRSGLRGSLTGAGSLIVLLLLTLPGSAAAQGRDSVQVEIVYRTKVEPRPTYNMCFANAIGVHADPLGKGSAGRYTYSRPAVSATPPEWTGLHEDIAGERITYLVGANSGGDASVSCGEQLAGLQAVFAGVVVWAYYTPPSNQPPAACFTFEEADESLAVDFDASCSNDPDGEVVQYAWDFGGAGAGGGSGAQTRFTYEEPGTYTVTLVVTDDDGDQSGPFVEEVEVTSNEFVVNSTGDDPDEDDGDERCDTGQKITRDGEEEDECTLRAAIEVAIERGGGRIKFDIPVGGGCEAVCTISPKSPLPTLTASVKIEGSSQPTGRIELDGAEAGPAAGLKLEAEDVEIEGLTISRFDQYGIEIYGGSGHRITNSRIGVLEGDNLNSLGGMLIADGATDVTIGGMTKEEENVIGGGVRVDGAGTHGVRMLRNRLELPSGWTTNRPLRLPIDLSGDGPSCFSWAGTDPSKPNRAVPPPRILDLKSASLSGIARPGATVVAYRVDAAGDEKGRYWATSVSPLGTGDADSDGKYVVDFDAGVAAGTRIVVGTVDTDGNSSELSQVRRPLIFIPGVGGSWLEGENGDNLFLPTAGTDRELNDRLARLAMNASGTASLTGEEVHVDGILEQRFMPYRPILQHLEGAGFDGDEHNTSPGDNDLWRFAYDWRRDPTVIATDLKGLIDQITVAHERDEVAVSCEVDVITHSNGGMVASAYVWNSRGHSRNRVNRLLMSAAPYLGTPQVIAAHTTGYLFDIEKSIPGTDLDWGRLIAVFQNLPDGYGLLPSKKYWAAAQSLSTYGMLPDLTGKPLKSYDEAFRFMTGAKTSSREGSPGGLDRNGPMWAQQQRDLHGTMNDWRQYDGPPQIFRHVGRLPLSTNSGWYLDWDYPDVPTEGSSRREPGDTDLHVAYRESLLRYLETGDGTVTLLSATLGGGVDDDGRSIGLVDYSGQETAWIEPFEYFPCKHVDIVSANCNNKKGPALEQMVDVITSSYEVGGGTAGKTAAVEPAAEVVGEALYISASRPVQVTVEDASGARTGPVDEGSLNKIQYDIEDIGYWPRLGGAVISINSDRAYTITVDATGSATTVRVSRSQASGSDVKNMMFHEQELGAEGQLRFTYAAGGTAPTATWDIDADGDGAYETAVEPGAVMVSSLPGPSLPRPEPALIRADLQQGSPDPAVTIEIPDVGGPVWNWQLETIPSWIQADAAGGQNPATLTVVLAASTLTAGVHRDTLEIAFAYSGFTTRSRIPVEIAIRTEAPTLRSITVQPKNRVLALGETLQFWALGKDQLGQPIDVSPHWSATGGQMSEAGVFTAGPTPGVYTVTASSADGEIVGSTDVEVALSTAAESGRELPVRVTLAPNYPNPFNPKTTIGYGLPDPTNVRLEVYDVFGRRVATLFDGYHPAGWFEVTFDATGLSSGMYVYRLHASGVAKTGRMVLLK